MISLIYILGRVTESIHARLVNIWWKNYLLAYCLSKKDEIHVADTKSLQFRNKTILHIEKGSTFNIGKDVVINSGNISILPFASRIYVSGTLTIADHTGISSSSIVCCKSITIGKYVNIGAGCLIMDSNMHSINWYDRENRKSDVEKSATAPVIICDYAFIGARSIINKGVTIGEKSIIAAGSVVVENIPANCIAGGNPCKVIKYVV